MRVSTSSAHAPRPVRWARMPGSSYCGSWMRRSTYSALSGRGRRDRLHRIRCAEEVRARCWSTGGAQDPGLQRQQEGRSRSGPLFDLWRFHAFFTTADPAIPDTIAADKTNRADAIIEQVHADLKNSALAHLPSAVFTANAAWLVEPPRQQRRSPSAPHPLELGRSVDPGLATAITCSDDRRDAGPCRGGAKSRHVRPDLE